MSILINTFLQMNSFIYCLLFAVGACVGSFLNVCIYRIPEGRSVVAPRSHCRSCGKTLAWYDNIPLFGWFLLRGKCRHCGAGFSIRYVFIELITALSFVLLWQQIGGWLAVLGMVFFSVMIIVTMIDLDHFMIPDRFTIGGMFLGVFAAFCLPELHGFESEGIFIVAGVRSMIMACIGVVVGAGILIWIAVLGEMIFRKEAMGFGDVKYMGLIGAICGWKGALFAIFGGATAGSLILIPWMLIRKMMGKEGSSVVPFGPWLSLGAALYFLFFRDAVAAYAFVFEKTFFG